MNKYKSVGTANFLLGVIGIALPLLMYAYAVSVHSDTLFVNLVFHHQNLTLLKILIFNAFLGIINFSLGIMTYALPTNSMRKYFADNIVIAITTLLFLLIITGYSYMLINRFIN